jgi:hypothetical protein
MKLQLGDKVLLFDETVRRGRSRKLSAQWIGPYTLTEIDKVNATITRCRKVTKVHVNRLKPFYWIRREDGKHRVPLFWVDVWTQCPSHLDDALSNSGEFRLWDEILMQTTWLRHLVDHRIDNSGIWPFTYNDEPENHTCNALDALHVAQQTHDILVGNTAEAQKGILQTISFIAYPITGCRRKSIPPIPRPETRLHDGRWHALLVSCFSHSNTRLACLLWPNWFKNPARKHTNDNKTQTPPPCELTHEQFSLNKIPFQSDSPT